MVKVAVPTFSFTVNPEIERIAESLSLIVEIAEAVAKVTCCELAFVILRVPPKVSCGSDIRSPNTATGMVTLFVPARIVYGCAVWAVKSVAVAVS